MAEKGEYSNINFYAGADYGTDSTYGSDFRNFGEGARYPASSFGFPTDPRLSSQLKAVSDKLNTGAKTVEVSGVTPGEWESVPQQHLKEINRLKKLTGVDLTFHGPLVEPTGISRYGWDEAVRKQSERQMYSSVERAHDLDPKGNIVITFHSSNGLPEPETKVINPKTKKEEITEFWVIDEKTGRFNTLKVEPDYFRGEEKEKKESMEEQYKKLNEMLEKQNKEAWFKSLQAVSYHANQGSAVIEDVFRKIGSDEKTQEEILKYYKKEVENPEQATEMLKYVKNPEIVKGAVNHITHGDLYLRDAYQDLQNLFNQAYEVSVREGKHEDINKLNAFRNEMKDKLKYIEEPDRLDEFADEILKGVNVLRTIKTPRTLKPLREFAVDKASDTFSGVAFDAYKKFKDSAPIISIENPPAGMGLTRAEDLRLLIDETRKKFVKRAVESGLSESQAKEQAEKLIGVTWDVGHINMIKKFGYGDEHLRQETKKVAPYVKHIHLSDNFGMEHTELPMGMGNVPMKEHLEELQKQYGDKLKDIKKIVETGGPWFRDFKVTPFQQTLSAFGSPIYGMQMAPYWNQASGSSGGYFAGYGQMLPEYHFSTYGSGFSNLPAELGGQMSGRNRLSGNPME